MMKKQKPKKKKTVFDVVSTLVIIALIGVLVYGVHGFLGEKKQYDDANNLYSELNENINIPSQDDDKNSAKQNENQSEASDQQSLDPGDYPDKNGITWNPLLKANPETYAVIYIPCVNTKYPVVKSHDNEDYVTHDITGKRSKSGAIFIDMSCSEDFSDMNTFVYGHNMLDGSMFGQLRKFQKDSSLVDGNPYVYIYTRDGRKLTYKIYGYEQVKPGDAVYGGFSGDDGYDSYVNMVKQKSVYDSSKASIDFSSRPRLLSLSTCYREGKHYRFVVNCAMVSEE